MVIYDFVEMSVRCYMRNKITLFFFPTKIFKNFYGSLNMPQGVGHTDTPWYMHMIDRSLTAVLLIKYVSEPRENSL